MDATVSVVNYRTPMDPYDLLGQLLILAVIFAVSNRTALFIFAIMIDNVYCALDFLRGYIGGKVDSTNIISTKMYNLSVIDRYICYLGLDIIYRCLVFLTWGKWHMIMYYTLTIAACPVLLNFIADKYLSGVFRIINKTKNRFIKENLAQQVANIINYLSATTLNLRPDVKAFELLPLFKDMEQITKFFYSFLTSFLIATLIQYTKNSGNRFYAKVIRYIYNYKTGDFIGGINDKKAREKFANIILYRKWEQLLLPDRSEEHV